MRATMTGITCAAILLTGCAGGASVDSADSTEVAPSTSAVATPSPTSDASTPAPSPTSGSSTPAPTPSPDAPDTIGKPLENALRGYFQTYGGLWDPNTLDFTVPLGPQIEPAAVALRIAFLEVVEAADADPATANPESNVAPLLTELSKEVEVVDAFVARVSKCAISANRGPCEIKEFEDQTEILKSQQRIAAAVDRIKLQD